MLCAEAIMRERQQFERQFSAAMYLDPTVLRTRLDKHSKDAFKRLCYQQRPWHLCMHYAFICVTVDY